MRGLGALMGTLAVTALALAPACSKEAQEVKKESQDAAQKIGEKAKEVGGEVAEAAKDVGQTIKEGAQTVDVKAALMVDRSIDASHIDVDTDADTKTVSLKGTVPTAAQKGAAEKVAREKAEGYKVRNLLTVVNR